MLQTSTSRYVGEMQRQGTLSHELALHHLSSCTICFALQGQGCEAELAGPERS